MSNNQSTAQSGGDEQVVKVPRSELPAYCPTEAMGLWNSHPRVYIPLEEEPVSSCPYCGTRYELVD